MRLRHLRLKGRSPTASTSSAMKMSQSTWTATEKPEAGEHARGVVADGGVHEAADVGEGGDVVELGVGLVLAHPEHGGVHVDVLAAGQLVVEAGARGDQARRCVRG